MTISASVQSLQVNRIFPNPDQPRKDFDPVAIEELAQSIKSNGLIQPITVVQAFRLKPHQRPPMSLNEILIPVQTDDDKELWSALNSNKKIPSRLQDSLDSLYAKLGNVSMVCESSLTNFAESFDAVYMIIAGERRWRASIHAKLGKIECVVKRVNTADIFRLAMIENALRRDMSPMETAIAVNQLVNDEIAKIRANELAEGLEPISDIEAEKLSAVVVSKETGIKKGTVLENIRLLTLLPEIQAALNRGEISTLHAWQLTRMKGDDKQIKLYKLILAGKCDTSSKLYQAAKAINQEAYLNGFEQTDMLGDSCNEDPQAAAIVKLAEDLAAKMATISNDDDTKAAIAKLSGDRLDYLISVLGNLSNTTKAVRKQAEFALGSVNVREAA